MVSRLLADERLLLAFPCLDLLVLLCQVTWRAAAGHEAVGAGVAFETVLLPDLSALHHLNDPVQCAAAQRTITDALVGL